MHPNDVSAVVCTMNSIESIERCLTSLREAGVGELIVVDASSTDGTRELAEELADQVLTDPGCGLGNARNLGIERTRCPLILNMGSDNVMPAGQLSVMIKDLQENDYQGVSARTIIEGHGFVPDGLNAWRSGRFIPGPAHVIGTPTLFVGDLLRAHPYDPTRVYSDDSELCERWAREFDATFGISTAFVLETGKATWNEVLVRCRMYGISDREVFRSGTEAGWSLKRKAQSLLHPLIADFLKPVENLSTSQAVRNTPFLAAFTAMRYGYWIQSTVRGTTQASKASII